MSWVHHGAEATAKATRLVAAAAAKAGMLEVPWTPLRVEVQRQAVVIGGGVAGLKTALELAERGLPVILVGKEPFPGGTGGAVGNAWRPGEKRPPGSSANSPAPSSSIRPSPFTPAPRRRALRAISAISSSK